MYFVALYLLVVLQILSTSVTAFAQEFLPSLIPDHSVALANTSISMFSVFSVNNPAEQQTVQFGPPQNDLSFQGRDQSPISHLNKSSNPSSPPRRKPAGRSSHNRHAAAIRSTTRSLTPAPGAPVSSPAIPPSAPNFFESEQDAADFATAVNSCTETLGNSNSTSDHVIPSPESATVMPEPRHVNKLPSRSRRPTDAMVLSLPLPTMSFPLEEEEEDASGLDAELKSLLDNLDGKMPAMFSPEYEAEIEAQAAQAREITGIVSQPEPEPVVLPDPPRPIRRLPKNRAGSSMMLPPPPPIIDESPKETDKEPDIDRRDLDENGLELSREVEAPFLPNSYRDEEIQAAQTLALVLATGAAPAPELPPLDLDVELARLRAAITKKKADKAARALTKGMSQKTQKYMLESNEKLYQESLAKSRSATPSASPSHASSSSMPPPLPQVSPSPTRMSRSSRRRCDRRDPFDDDDEEGAKDLDPIPKPDLSRYRTGYMLESKSPIEEKYSFSPISSTAMDSSKDVSRQEQQIPKESPSPENAMSSEPLPSTAHVSPQESGPPVSSPSPNTSDSQASSSNKMALEYDSQEIKMECATQPLFGPSSISPSSGTSDASASMEADVLPLFNPAPTLTPSTPAPVPESMNVGPAPIVYSNTSSLDPQMDTGMSASEQSESMEADVLFDPSAVSSISESMTVDPEPVVATYTVNPSWSTIPRSAHVDEAMAVEIPTYVVPIQDSEMRDFEVPSSSSSSSQGSQPYVAPSTSNHEQTFWFPNDRFIATPPTPEATPKPTGGSAFASYPTPFYSNELDIAGSSTSVLFADAVSFDSCNVRAHGSCSPCETPGLQVFLSPTNEQAPLVNDASVKETMTLKQPAPVKASQRSRVDAPVVGKPVVRDDPRPEAALTAPPTPVLPVSPAPETPPMAHVRAGDKVGARHGNVPTATDILEIVQLLENLHLSPGFWAPDSEVQPFEETVDPGDLEAPSQEVVYKSSSDSSDTESESDGSEASASSNWSDEDDYLDPMYSLEPFIAKSFEWIEPPRLSIAAVPTRTRQQAEAVRSKRAADSLSFNNESRPTTRSRCQYRRPTPYPSKDQVPSVKNLLLSRLVPSVNLSRFF